MLYLEALLSSTGLIFLMEIGDKTMLTTMCLSAQYQRRAFVLMASIVALAASSIIAVILGTFLATSLPLTLLNYVSALLFLVLGGHSLINWNLEEEQNCENPGTLFNMFTLVFFSELGDKSQLAVLGLAVQSAFPIVVFIGSIIGFILVNTVGVFIGDKLSRSLPMKSIRIATGIAFITFGILIILGIL